MTSLHEQIAAMPKVSLHDHLDGALRPATIIELAAEVGHELPTTDPAELGSWFTHAASSGSLERYLETFAHTVAVMQTPEGLRRVAEEAVLDLAADGVVHGELRYAPEQHLQRGLSLQEVVDAVRSGLQDGVAAVADTGRSISVGTIVTAMRHADRGDEVAELALANRDRGVVGFDIAGAEDGFPPSRLASAFATLRDADFPVTIHAGEAAGLDSIAEAVHLGAARRIGHGVRIVDDIAFPADGAGEPELGRLAHWLRDCQIPLEMCPSSNVQTGAARSIAEHPITALKALGFAVTINPDNRLMSGTTLTREMTLLADEAGWTLEDLEESMVIAAWNAFLHHDERGDLVDQILLPAFADDEPGRHRAVLPGGGRLGPC
jgi:adenosine deaminase